MIRSANTLSCLMRAALAVLLMAAVIRPALAQETPKLLGLGCGIGSVQVTRNTARAGINVLGITGTELVLTFENVQNLSAKNLGMCARLMGPLELLDILSRLPDQGLTGLLQLPLPLVISVEPPASGGLSFTNTYRAEIHTEMLGFTVNSPYRLYKAPHGGTFYDVTDEVAQGSVRTRGTTGGFSDFIVVLDIIPNAEHAEDKYEYLSARLESSGLAFRLRMTLQAELDNSRAAYDANDYAGAIESLALFETKVREKAGVSIPNLWRAQRDRDNIAGDLIGYSESLKFSIQRTAGLSAAAAKKP